MLHWGSAVRASKPCKVKRVGGAYEGQRGRASGPGIRSPFLTSTIPWVATNRGVAPFGSHVSLAVTKRATVVVSSTANRYA